MPLKTPMPFRPKNSPRSRPPNRAFSRPPAQADSYRTIGGGVKIVHEDEHILVLDKPAGLLTSKTTAAQGSRTNDSVFDLVKQYAKAKSKKRGVRAWIIHRLDKEASGLLVFAKNELAFQALKEEFRTKRAHRLYAAVVEGEFETHQPSASSPSTRKRPPQLPSGTIQNYLYEDERGLVHNTNTPSAVPRTGRFADDDDSDPTLPRLAVTHYQVQSQSITNEGARALLHVRLETGRKNQIRAHMQSLKKSIVGDRRYGARTDPIARLCLHATELGFAHPATGQSVRYHSPVPREFFKLVGIKPPSESSVTTTPSLTKELGLHEPLAAPFAQPTQLTDDASSKATPPRASASSLLASIGAPHIPAQPPSHIDDGTSQDASADDDSDISEDETSNSHAFDTHRASAGSTQSSPSPRLIEEVSNDDLAAQPGPTKSSKRVTLSDLEPPAPQSAQPSGSATGWDHVAVWYDNLLEERGSDHHEQTILPGTLRLLSPTKGMRVLDIACGQGILCRRLAEQRVECVGLDAAPNLIERAAAADKKNTYIAGDARDIAALASQHHSLQKPFDAITCIMALMNIEPLSPVLAGAAKLLKPHGSFIAVILHPAFRPLGQSSWDWDIPPEERLRQKDKGKRKGKRAERTPKNAEPFKGTQFRRIDGYLSAYPREIVMNPGAAAHGNQAIKTTTFHRPIQHYIKSLAEAGLLVSALEEWSSQRQSQPGPRAQAENRARREIPMFLALRAQKT